MKTTKLLPTIVCSVAICLLSGHLANANAVPQNYGDITLSGGFQTGHLPEWWDLTAGYMVLSFTYNANGLVDDFGGGAHAWAELGVRSPCYGDFNPTWMAEGAGVWLATDYDWAANTFDPDPPGSPTLDIDDKLILQKGGGQGEGNYNLPSPPPNPWANHAVWFDRDGVDQWQALMWGAIDGVTYNTGGTYDVVIILNATSDTTGEAYMFINGEPQGFYDPGWHPGPADLMPAGMTFTGDMKHLQVFYGLYGYGATHTVVFEDINIYGETGEPPLAWCLKRSIDIKPGSYPNSINLNKKKGGVPVAILGSETFDVMTVDVTSLDFEEAAPAHDLTDPDVYIEHLEDVNGDGYIDLVFHFMTPELTLDEDSIEAILKCYTNDGEFLWGKDEINVVGGGK
ncbi:MAG: hypothetical protein ACYTFW_01905 [Planctomycetota bacterium]|jgi:hypothetical protein